MNPSLLAVALGALLVVSGPAAAAQGGDTAVKRAEAAAIPANARDRFREATRLAEAGQMDQAIAILQELTDEFPNLPEPYNNLAALYAREGRLDQAKEVLEQAIRTDESYATVYENLSTVYVEMARDSYVKALRIEEPRNSPHLQLLDTLKTGPTPRGGGHQVVASAPEGAVQDAAKPAEPEKAAAEASEPRKPAVSEPEEPAPSEAGQPEPADAGGMQAAETKSEAESEKGAATTQAPTQVAEAEPAQPSPDKGPPQAALAMLRQWARAWSEQQVDTYLDFYAPGFEPESGRTRAQWAETRRERIRRPEWIEVQLEDFDFTRVGPERLKVKLLQHYKASNYQDKTVKRLVLVQGPDGWKIHSEQSLKIIR